MEGCIENCAEECRIHVFYSLQSLDVVRFLAAHFLVPRFLAISISMHLETIPHQGTLYFFCIQQVPMPFETVPEDCSEHCTEECFENCFEDCTVNCIVVCTED